MNLDRLKGGQRVPSLISKFLRFTKNCQKCLTFCIVFVASRSFQDSGGPEMEDIKFERIFCAEQINVPPELPRILKDLTKEVSSRIAVRYLTAFGIFNFSTDLSLGLLVGNPRESNERNEGRWSVQIFDVCFSYLNLLYKTYS